MSSLSSSAAATLPRSGGQALLADLLKGLRALLRNPLTVCGVVVITLLAVVALFAPWIATHDPLAQDLASTLQAPGAAHWLDHAVIAIALTAWPPIARLARAETLSLRNADFVVVAQLQGASSSCILLRHIVPLCLSSVVVRLTMNMAGIILTAAGLGFLGLGAQAPLPEWGAMISDGRRYMLDSWWMVAAPGVAILLSSLAFNLVGDGLYDVLDPRSK